MIPKSTIDGASDMPFPLRAVVAAQGGSIRG